MCRPFGHFRFKSMHTGAFDPGRGCNSPSGLNPFLTVMCCSSTRTKNKSCSFYEILSKLLFAAQPTPSLMQAELSASQNSEPTQPPSNYPPFARTSNFRLLHFDQQDLGFAFFEMLVARCQQSNRLLRHPRRRMSSDGTWLQ